MANDDPAKRQDLDPNHELGMEPERLSKRVIFVIVGFLVLVLLLVFYGLMSGGSKAQQEEEQEQTAAAATDDTARNAVQSELAGSIDAAAKRQRQQELLAQQQAEAERLRREEEARKRAAAAAQGQPNPTQHGNAAPGGNQGPGRAAAPDQQAQELQRLRQLRMQRFEQALGSKIGAQVNQSALAEADTAQGREQREQQLAQRQNEYQRRLQEIRSNSGTQVMAGRSAAAPGVGAYGASSGQGLGSAVRSGGADSPYSAMAADGWELNNQLEAPIGRPYLVRAGTVIPATLISGINSDLPGQIIGQVSQNVYDSATGKYLLVPQGTRLIGAYGTQVAYGQERVLVAWQRLVYPDGKALDIGGMPGTDMAGYSGFSDLVDNHWWKLISSAFLMSGIVATVSVATDDDDDSSNDDDDSTSMNDEMMRAMATQFGNVIAQVIQRNLNISPTIEIRPGYKFNVMTTRDMNFAGPYQEFDYL